MALEFEKEQDQQMTSEFKRLETDEPEEEVKENPLPENPSDNDQENAEDMQLNLFGEPEEAKETETPKSKFAKSKKNQPKAKPKEDEKFGVDYTVYYAGHSEQVPEDGMTLEEIRQFLETNFPELSKERTEMTVDKEKKHIVPVVKGAKKG